MVNAVQANPIGHLPAPGVEKLSATQLRPINESNAKEVSTRRELFRENSNLPKPGEIPREAPAISPGLKNQFDDEGRSPAPALEDFIEKDIQESLVNFEDSERGSLIDQRV